MRLMQTQAVKLPKYKETVLKELVYIFPLNIYIYTCLYYTAAK